MSQNSGAQEKQGGGSQGPPSVSSSSCASASQMPTWYQPRPLESMMDFWDKFYPLRLYNSLTRTKTPFVPLDERRVLWYMCGPTVYDKSHLGHARTYVWFDTMRRILQSYFKYDILLCMNITDIDDKIILRSMENGYKEQNPDKPLPENKEERTKFLAQWADQQPPQENMRRAVELARFFEQDFFDDMKALGVHTPDVLTRVSEYVPEVVTFVQKIIDNGFAYESNGSVYFDVPAYSKSGATYGKLLPENVGQLGLLAEGEGTLTVSAGQGDKRSPNDFALWKRSKPGEPSWESPWGLGRPGWHIECSVMASETLKKFEDGVIDIHSGGIDLRFPHHDNEIAQSEAYFCFKQWINYFVHTGHLNIQGLKMSKSLKNFLTIKEALERNTARQIRLVFLLHKYNQEMDYSQDTMDHAEVMEKFFSEFFQNVKARLRELGREAPEKWAEREFALVDTLVESKKKVHEALCDDLDTPQCMAVLAELVKATKKYLSESESPVPMLLRSVAEYVTHIFKCFGLISNDPTIGFPLTSDAGGSSREETLQPVLDVFAKFRDGVRTAARAGDVSELLRLCDQVRDDDLADIGVRLEDRAEGGSIWKLADPETLKMEREQKLDAQRRKEEVKRQKAEAAAKKEAEMAAKASVRPEDMFKNQLDKFSKFDEQGLPTHDAAGEPVAKSQLKKLKKEQEKQAKLYAKYNSVA